MSTEPPRTPTILATTTFNNRPHRLVFIPAPARDERRGSFCIEHEGLDAMGNPSWSLLIDARTNTRIEFGADREVGAMLYALAFDKEA